MSTVWTKPRFIVFDPEGGIKASDDEQDVKDVIQEGGSAIQIADDGTVAQVDVDLEPSTIEAL